MIRFFLTTLFLCIISGVFSQEISIKNAVGSYYGNENMTLKQIKQNSLNEAKIDALTKAGISENINSYSQLFNSEIDNNYTEMFSKNIINQIKGAVTEVEINDIKLEFSDNNTIKATTTISCKVIKHTDEPDLTFDASISGIKGIYNSNESFSFLLNPTKNAYMIAFVVNANNEKSFVIFPNQYEKSFLLEKNTEYKFPSDKAGIEISIEAETNKDSYKLIVVILKNEIQYTKEVNYKNISEWLSVIPLNEKKVFVEDFYVIK